MSLSDVGYKISGYPMVLCARAGRLWDAEVVDGRRARRYHNRDRFSPL